MRNYTIYIEGVPFTARQDVINELQTAMLRSGLFKFDKDRAGYYLTYKEN